MNANTKLNPEDFKLQAMFVAENIKNGMTLEQSIEKSFNDVNSFICEQMKSEEFSKEAFNQVKELV